MKIRTLYILDVRPNFFSLLNDLSLHHPTVEEALKVTTLEQLKEGLEERSEPCIILHREDSQTAVSLVRSVIPPHLQDQTVIVKISADSQVVGPLYEGDYNLVAPEAFSFLQFDELITRSSEIISEQVEKRFSSALDILGQEIGAQIDQVAYLKRKGYKADLSQTILKDMGSVIGELNGSERKQFLSSFFSYCETAQPFEATENGPGKPYVGVSSRVRKKLSSRAQTKLAQATSAMRKVAGDS